MDILNKLNDRAWALLLWILFIAFILANRSLSPVEHAEVFLIYRDAALLWLKGSSLYDGSGTGFIYFPHSAVLMIPFTFMSPLLDSLLWRLVNIGVFAIGVGCISRLAAIKLQRSILFPVTLVSVLMAASAAKLGQMTLIMVGLMMIALLDLHQENWWRSALWLVLAFALKPLAAILILLVAVLYPRSIIPLLTSFAAFVVIPFGLKDPAYVWSQYQDSVFTMQQVAAFGRDNPFAQIFWMLREAGVDVSDTMRFVLRLLFASGTLGLCWWLQRRQSRATFLVYLFALSTCYVLLFNPRTENNTYAILAPAIGVFVAWSFYTRTGLLRYDHAAISTGYLLSNRIGKWLTGFATVWIKPLLCCVFLVLIIYQSINEDDPRKIATDN